MKTGHQDHSSQKSTTQSLFIFNFFFRQPEYQTSGAKPKSAKNPSIIQDMKCSAMATQADMLQTHDWNLPMTANAKPKHLSSTGGVPCSERITQITTWCPKFDIRENAQLAPAGAQHKPCTISWKKLPVDLNSGPHFSIRLCQSSQKFSFKIIKQFLGPRIWGQGRWCRKDHFGKFLM